MSIIDLNTVVSYRKDIMTSKLIDDEMVMMNIDRGSYYGLEESGTYIWGKLEEPIHVHALIEDLVTQFPDVARDACTADTLNFLNEMLKEELIKVHSG